MFGKKKSIPQIDKEQMHLIENAQRRIKQKKRLYFHFVIFLIGAIFLIVLNTVLGVGEQTKIFGLDWFVFAILAWLFIFFIHLFNVFVTHKFMGKEWEEAQLSKLVAQQKERISKLETEVEKTNPIEKPYPIETAISPEKKTKVRKNLTLIAAAGENDTIGKDNELIWHLGDDLRRFKTLTSNHCMIMGRKTFESFSKPLPNRTHIVITRQQNYTVPTGVIVVHNLEDALDAAKNDVQPFIIGGGEIYKQALPYADNIELTRVHESFDGDAFFPKIDPLVWKETQTKLHQKDEHHKYSFSFITYQRR
ncbi:dihydrofolate reductase [Gelidibacter algens]|jgi:dihydrofolate reductase|uniref:dihydrofolate reductase n=1 Tax=Gelidibacter algens TaxID=49280 RepID=A0A327S135_9FLAO|nr:dihydrofolate reductase [Gelidibacter algens]RAJ22571.1 dihydrofolate reductase [Gelidibacter algens]